MEYLLFYLKANIFLVLAGLLFMVFLKEKTFYTLNRFFLLNAIFISFIVPFVNFLPEIREISGYTPVIQLPFELFKPMLEEQPETNGLFTILIPLYLAGVGLLTGKFLIQLISLFNLALKSQRKNINGYPVLNVPEPLAPFSFFKYIFISPKDYTNEELKNILRHESIHVRKLHSFDILLGEFCRIVYWFNPATHLLLKWIKENIEFETDREVLCSGVDSKVYQYNLLKITTEKSRLYISNQFNILNLKKRIVMMNKNRSSRYNLAVYGIAISILFSTVLVLNSCNKENFFGKDSSLITETNQGLNAKKANNASELLKGLIIVDGEKYTGDVNLIDPANITSISVYKGEEAIRLYGEEGKNGVIVITTKK